MIRELKGAETDDCTQVRDNGRIQTRTNPVLRNLKSAKPKARRHQARLVVDNNVSSYFQFLKLLDASKVDDMGRVNRG